MRSLAISILCLAACGDAPMASSQYIEGFNPPPPPDGYVRYITPTKHALPPGFNDNLCEFVAAPFDHDINVIGSQGYQSVSGHHLALYGTKNTREKVGTSRPCTLDDMSTIQYIGAVGGEGVNVDVVKLPPSVAFRLPKGMALMAQTHYLNASDKTVDAQSVIDLHMVDPSPEVIPLGAFTLHTAGFSIPNNGEPTTYEGRCVASRDMPMILASNHMHDWGLKMLHEVIHLDGTRTTLVEDPVWNNEWSFNPRWVRWDVNAPMLVHKGETLHTVCTWRNTTNHVLAFPEEMCEGATYFLNGIDADYCEGG